MFGGPRTVESIVAPLNKILDRLKEHRRVKNTEGAQAAEAMRQAYSESDKADALINKFETLLSTSVEVTPVPYADDVAADKVLF